MKYSIVVPVYNAEEYLEECILSVVNQTYQNWELILVNDGSTDNSLQICEKYAAVDVRIKIVNQENSGPLIARINGINNASGNYVGFLDSDDYLDINMLEQINSIVSQYEPDMLMFNMKKVNLKGEVLNIPKHVYSDFEEVLTIEKDNLLYDFIGTNKLNSICSKIIKKEILSKDDTNYFQFDRLMQSEDRLQSLPSIYYSNKIIYFNKPFYNYRTNPNSITFNFSYKNLIDTLETEKYIEKFLLSKNVSKDLLVLSYNYFIYYIIGGYLRYISFNRIEKSEKKRVIKEIRHSDIFNRAKKYARGKNKILYYLIRKEKVILLDLLSLLNKRRLHKQSKN